MKLGRRASRRVRQRQAPGRTGGTPGCSRLVVRHGARGSEDPISNRKHSHVAKTCRKAPHVLRIPRRNDCAAELDRRRDHKRVHRVRGPESSASEQGPGSPGSARDQASRTMRGRSFEYRRRFSRRSAVGARRMPLSTACSMDAGSAIAQRRRLRWQLQARSAQSRMREPDPMHNVRFVGRDVHKESIAIAVADGDATLLPRGRSSRQMEGRAPNITRRTS